MSPSSQHRRWSRCAHSASSQVGARKVSVCVAHNQPTHVSQLPFLYDSLPRIENALPGRDGYEVEIFGMEGIPAPDVADYKRRKEIELGLSAGSITQPPAKRPRVENRLLTEEELRLQLEAHRALMGANEPPTAPAPTDANASAVYGAPPQAYAAPPVPAPLAVPPIMPPGMVPPPFFPGGPPPGIIPGQPPMPPFPGMPFPPGSVPPSRFRTQYHPLIFAHRPPPPGFPLPPGFPPPGALPPGMPPPPFLPGARPPFHPPPPTFVPASAATAPISPPGPTPSQLPPPAQAPPAASLLHAASPPVAPPTPAHPTTPPVATPPAPPAVPATPRPATPPTAPTMPNKDLFQTNPSFKKKTEHKYPDANFSPVSVVSSPYEYLEVLIPLAHISRMRSVRTTPSTTLLRTCLLQAKSCPTLPPRLLWRTLGARSGPGPKTSSSLRHSFQTRRKCRDFTSPSHPSAHFSRAFTSTHPLLSFLDHTQKNENPRTTRAQNTRRSGARFLLFSHGSVPCPFLFPPHLFNHSLGQFAVTMYL